jgi:hypothetical protein
MKQTFSLTFLAALLFSTACSSSSSTGGGAHAQIIEPDLGVRQVVGPSELGFPQGPMEVKYEFIVKNNSSEPLTLRKVHVATVNPAGGAYSVRPRDYFLKQVIAPNTTGSVEVWVRAYGWGRGTRDSEPVTLKGVAYFDSPVGFVNKVFVRELGQYPGQND